MCTAISFKTNDHYFGRNLDLEYHYNESVIITPRNHSLSFRHTSPMQHHYAMIGIGIIETNYPLYYDAVNEFGLCAAGLHFPGNAHYFPWNENAVNIASFELVPWILSKFKTVKELLYELPYINITDTAFNENYAPSPLHWLVSDAEGSIVIECTKEGLKIYDNQFGILTNNPPFHFHSLNLTQYLNLTASEPINRFSPKLNIVPFSHGVGAFGLPGDASSASRFIRAAFHKLNSTHPKNDTDSITQFFHILSSVEQLHGCVKVNDLLEKTVYSSCCNASKGVYYYKTYENSQINAVSLHREQLDSNKITSYPLIWQQHINRIN